VLDLNCFQLIRAGRRMKLEKIPIGFLRLLHLPWRLTGFGGHRARGVSLTWELLTCREAWILVVGFVTERVIANRR
jgi:hypothetical protein